MLRSFEEIDLKKMFEFKDDDSYLSSELRAPLIACIERYELLGEALPKDALKYFKLAVRDLDMALHLEKMYPNGCEGPVIGGHHGYVHSYVAAVGRFWAAFKLPETKIKKIEWEGDKGYLSFNSGEKDVIANITKPDGDYLLEVTWPHQYSMYARTKTAAKAAAQKFINLIVDELTCK